MSQYADKGCDTMPSVQRSPDKVKRSHHRKAVRVARLLYENKHDRRHRHKTTMLMWALFVGVLCLVLVLFTLAVRHYYTGGGNGF
jgi:hypothetical protein